MPGLHERMVNALDGWAGSSRKSSEAGLRSRDDLRHPAANHVWNARAHPDQPPLSEHAEPPPRVPSTRSTGASRQSDLLRDLGCWAAFADFASGAIGASQHSGQVGVEVGAVDRPLRVPIPLLGHQDRAASRRIGATGVVDQQATMRPGREPAKSHVGPHAPRQHLVLGHVMATLDHADRQRGQRAGQRLAE
jgi:hypothetical protein